VDKPTINISTKNGVDYASVYTPYQISGRKQNKLVYLGRVIDKAAGIYRNKTMGTYKYCLETGEYTPLTNYEANPSLESPSAIFGDVFVARQVLEDHGLLELFRSADPVSPDTLTSYVIFRTISSLDDAQALTWWEGTFAKILTPLAQMDSPGLRACLSRLGELTVQTDFFKRYLARTTDGLRGNGILIDSPDPTPTSTQNLENAPSASNNRKDRIIQVIDKKTRAPLFIKYVTGPIIYDDILNETLAQLKTYNLSINMAVLDSNYYSQQCVTTLYRQSVPFFICLGFNSPHFNQLVDYTSDKIVHIKNMHIYNDSIYYIAPHQIDLFGHKGYAYAVIDSNRRQEETLQMVRSSGLGALSIDEQEEELKKCGFFLLISSNKLDPAELPPRLHRRIKDSLNLELLNQTRRFRSLESDDDSVFRGHLFLSFLSSICGTNLKNKLKLLKLSNVEALHSMHYMFCHKVGDKYMIDKPTPKMKKILNALGVNPPVFWPEVI
jgi:hypothetical protein